MLDAAESTRISVDHCTGVFATHFSVTLPTAAPARSPGQAPSHCLFTHRVLQVTYA